MRKSMFLGLTDRNDLMMETVCSVALMIFWNCSSSLTSCSETVSVEPGGYICQRGKAWLGASFSGAPGSGLVQRHDRFRVLMLRVLDPNLHHLAGWSVHSGCKSSNSKSTTFTSLKSWKEARWLPAEAADQPEKLTRLRLSWPTLSSQRTQTFRCLGLSRVFLWADWGGHSSQSVLYSL